MKSLFQGAKRVRFRKLRTAWSVFWALACILVIALWVRSYWWCVIVYYRPADTAAYIVRSDEGTVSFGDWSGHRVRTLGDPLDIGWTRRKYWRPEGNNYAPNASPFRKVFREFRRTDNFGYQVPDWFVLVLAAALGASPWLGQRKWRFSVRTLLIATTLVAVLLGVLAASI